MWEYEIRSFGTYHTEVYLFDGTECLGDSDDEGPYQNFYLRHELTSGNTYQVLIYLYPDDLSALEEIDLSVRIQVVNYTGEVRKVWNMKGMFGFCNSLERIDLNSFDTLNVNLMDGMVQECRSLKTLHISNFDTSNVTNAYSKFEDCSMLEKIYVSDNWTMANVADGDAWKSIMVSFRGYMILKDPATGNETVRYTDVVAESYNMLNTQN